MASAQATASAADNAERVYTAEQQGYLDVLENAFEHLLQATNSQSGENGWQTSRVSNGVTVMMKTPPDQPSSALACVKGTARIRAPAELILEWVWEPAKVKQWDDLYDDGIKIEELSPIAQVEHLLYKRVFPIAARDFCVVSGIKRLDNGVIMEAIRSVTHPECPAVSSHVRGEVIDGGFAICPVDGCEGEYDVTYVTRIDLKGNIPSMVVNYINQSGPMCVASMREKIQANYAAQQAAS